MVLASGRLFPRPQAPAAPACPCPCPTLPETCLPCHARSQLEVSEDAMLGPTAVAAVEAACSSLPRLHHMNRQPIGHYVYEFDDATKAARKQYGMKTFIFSSLVRVGDGIRMAVL